MAQAEPTYWATQRDAHATRPTTIMSKCNIPKWVSSPSTTAYLSLKTPFEVQPSQGLGPFLHQRLTVAHDIAPTAQHLPQLCSIPPPLMAGPVRAASASECPLLGGSPEAKSRRCAKVAVPRGFLRRGTHSAFVRPGIMGYETPQDEPA